MPADFAPLTSEVAELTTVADSAVALMDGFETRLSDAIAADNLADNSNVSQLRDAFAAEKAKLADAVTRNTPTAEPTPDTGGTPA